MAGTFVRVRGTNRVVWSVEKETYSGPVSTLKYNPLRSYRGLSWGVGGEMGGPSPRHGNNLVKWVGCRRRQDIEDVTGT